MALYPVTITNGAGSANLPAGLYDVTSTVTGYSNISLDPATFTATSGTGSQAFTIAATGTLTFNVNDSGGPGGNPITSGTFIRCNQAGTVDYGTAMTISALGVCVFNYVPFDAVTPVAVYVRQLTSDETHSIYDGVITVDMSTSTQSQYVQNSPAALQSFTFTDANYAGLPISGSMSFDGPQA